MRTIKLTLCYDGAAYRGWQRQPGNRTIQDEVEQAILRITGEMNVVSGSGRTDSGVHALAQVASFHTECKLPPAAIKKALNAELPNDIVVVDAAEAEPGFHARKWAKRKRYRYVIHNSRTGDVFRRGTSWHYCYGKLDAEAMHRAAQHWRGTHDFRSFESQWPQRSSSVRTVLDIECRRLPEPTPKLIQFEVEADGFLYNMVRTMVGTLIEVGRGRKPESWAQEILTVGDRRSAGMKVPAQGLFLMSVCYDDPPASQT